VDEFTFEEKTDTQPYKEQEEWEKDVQVHFSYKSFFNNLIEI
jgi:hypothetical protein